jgi:hypothetical protein
LGQPGILVALLVAAGLPAACSLGPGLSRSAGGIVPGEAQELSLTVAQLRAQYPQLSANGLAYDVRQGPEAELAGRVSLALQGQGRSVTAGIDAAKGEPVSLTLFLDKTSYQEGYARVTLGQGHSSTWPILAFDQRGKADGDFEFLYLLGNPAGGSAYLALLGGSYKEGDAALYGMEGTLLIPSPAGTVAGWQRAYKLDFGFRAPAEPAYRALVDEAAQQFRNYERRMSSLERIQAEHQRLEGQRTRLLEQAGAEDTKAEDTKSEALVAAEQRLTTLQEQWVSEKAEARTLAIRYYQTRARLAQAFAEFLDSNRYRWRRLEGQQEAFTYWRKADRDTAAADGLTTALLTQVDDPAPVSQARREALAAIDKYANAAKAPAPKQ